MMLVIAVNYGTPELIHDWASNIRADNPNAKLLVVDNFHSNEVREQSLAACKTHDVKLLPSENVGYGRGINRGLSYLLEQETILDTDTIVFGNLDVALSQLTLNNQTQTPCAYIPIVFQNGINRNPFMTQLQRKFVWVYDVVTIVQKPLALRLAAGIIKVLGKIPSAPYAVHGSLFVMNGAALKKTGAAIFNEDTFLYCEEMEFAEVLRQAQIPLETCSIEVRHIGKVSTGKVTSTLADFIRVWLPSWKNWRARW